MELRDATYAILDSSDPASLLGLADMYMQAFSRMPDQFILPVQHSVLKPVIESFHDDLEDYVAYVKALRDAMPRGGKKTDVHHVYRTLSTRYVQQCRRARLDKAITKVENMLNRQLDTDERKRVGIKLEQNWGARRMAMLKAARNTTPSGRLSTDDRSIQLEQFWKQIDDEIEAGNLPMFKI